MPHEDWIINIAVSPDGHLLATGNRNGTVILWDVETETVRFTVPHKKGWMTDIALSPDGRFLVTGSQDRTATLWDR